MSLLKYISGFLIAASLSSSAFTNCFEPQKRPFIPVNLTPSYEFVPGDCCDCAERRNTGLVEVLYDLNLDGFVDEKVEYIFIPRVGWAEISQVPTDGDQFEFNVSKHFAQQNSTPG